MGNKITELYTEEDILIIKRKQRLWRAAAAGLAAITLALCVFFVIKTGTRIKTPLLVSAIVVSTLGGWAVITIAHSVLSRLRREEKHTLAMLSGERELISGSFTVTDDLLHVIGGVSMRRVDVSGNDKTAAVQLFDKKTPLFPAQKARAVVCVYGFITAYEVGYEDS